MSKADEAPNEKELVSRMRRQSIGYDVERRDLGQLADRLAVLGEQVAIVARMGEEDIDIIDDSEHIFNKSHEFALRCESHQLNGQEAFSFDDAFDDNRDSWLPGKTFCFAYCHSSGRIQLPEDTIKSLSCKYEDIRVVSLLQDWKDESTNVFNSLMKASVPQLDTPVCPPIPDGAVDCMLVGGWGENLNISTSELVEGQYTKQFRPLMLYLMACPERTKEFSSNSFKMSMIASLVSSTVIAFVSSNALSLLEGVAEVAATATWCSSQLPSAKAVTNVPKILFTLDSTCITDTSPATPVDPAAADNSFTCNIMAKLMRSLSASDTKTLADRIDSYFGSDEVCIISAIDPRIDISISPTGPTPENIQHTSVLDLYRTVAVSMQTTDVDDDDEDGSDDVSVGSFLQVVCPLLRTYLSTVCPVEPEGSEEREAQGTIAAGSNERGEEDDDWDGEEIVWAEGAVNSQQDDSLATSSHTMVSIDLSNSPKAVDSAQVHAVAEKCLSKYRAVMLQHVLDPAVTPASLSLFGDGYIDQGAAGDDVCTHSDEGMTVSRKNSYALNASVDCGEVDADLAIRLEYIFKRAEKGAVGTLRKHFPAYSMAEALQVLSPAFQVEREKYTKHSRERSLLYCEKVLREARAEVGLYYMQSDAHIEKGQAAEAINGVECKSEHSENVDTPTANGVSREEMAAKLTKVTEIYFANARGSAKQQVIAAFFADKLCGGESGQISEESDVQAENALLKEQIQQYQSTNARLKSRIESLVAENTQLHESVEDKTDKALDAWAALQEKYISLEMVLKAMKEETARKDEYISKLKSHVARVEQVNEAMKKGVAQILDEEDQTQSRHAPAQFSTSSFADLWSLALSCAIGAPLDDELSISENRHRASSSTGPGWISASTSSAKESSSTDRKTGSTE